MSTDVTGDEARTLVRRELLHPDYQQESLVQRALAWIQEIASDLLSRAQSLSAPSAIAVVVLIFVLTVILVMSLGRVRRSAEVTSRSDDAVLDPTRSANDLLHDAEQARAAGDLRRSAVAAFRSAATREVERGAVAPSPDATARDLARAILDEDAALGREFTAAAGVFEVAHYSRLPLDAEDCDRLLALARGRRVAAWADAAELQVPR